MFIQLSIDNFLRGLHNQSAALGVEQTEIMIGLRGRPFDHTERANEWPGESITANRKIEHGALGRGAVERGFRDRHLAHRIFFHARPTAGHAG